MRRALLCRYGEIFLKSGNRRRFETLLRDNVRAAVAGIPGARVEAPHGRVVVHLDEARAEEAAARVQRVFGLVSLSLASIVPADLAAISDAAVAEARGALARAQPATFKIEARRSDKHFPLPSPEIARQVGARVAAATGLPVDVHDPALTIGIEVGTEHAFVYAGNIPCPGGLPVGSAGRALLLLSGGIDSPVAGWLAAKRGLAVDAVYFHSPPYVGEKSRDKVVTLARTLAGWQAARSLTVVGFTDLQKRLRDAGPAELAVVLYRRAMMRIADAVGDGLGSEALVTGENLGQVASQTVQNMAVIDAAARRVVLRPLVTYDKVETTALARRLGTFETSILPFDDCCSLFVPPHPVTRARPQDAERAESTLDMAAAVAAAAAAAERIDLPAPGVAYTSV
ncbi:MAG TPA: tRNA uracil 4-sulfurtransferase ThiI [Polyangia bacterium]|nr:tRNA uracil 4-sulfurtransferase ThiI [Polyangia bacterium]